tara:strand:- start:198 stop:410 length:213 start_codon:yes stop_codon:yes gene_type:complete
MPDIKTFYPGATASNPINNSTDAVNSTTATTATNVDDQNSANNIKVWAGTKVQYNAVNPKDANTLYLATE